MADNTVKTGDRLCALASICKERLLYVKVNQALQGRLMAVRWGRQDGDGEK